MKRKERENKHTALIAERMDELFLCNTAITILIHVVEELLLDKKVKGSELPA